MKVYISIPITGHPVDRQKHAATQIAGQIRAYGHTPVNPFATPEPPGLLSERERYAYYMGRDIEQLLLCDAIYLADGWQKSTGCQIEYHTARLRGLHIAATPFQLSSLNP